MEKITTLPSNKYTNLELGMILRDPLHRPAVNAIILKKYISFILKWPIQDSLINPFLSLKQLE